MSSLDDDRAVAVERGRLFLSYAENPIIIVNARFLDRVLAVDGALVLTVDGCSALLTITQGETAAAELAQELAQYTRSAPIRDEETYEYTKTVLKACTSRRRHSADFVTVGDEPVRATEDMIYIGDFACRIADLETYAEAAASLPLPNGQLQAALAMLVVTQWRRQEDANALGQRILDYEATIRFPPT